MWNFFPISGLRAFEEVVDQIVFAVRAGAFKPGDRLPLVEQLAETMQVSKPTIGEAVKALSRAGVLVAQRGASGGLTLVSDNIPDSLMMRRAPGWRESSVKELVEARRPIEMQIVMLAAERATEEDFAALRQAIEKLKDLGHVGSARRTQLENQFRYGLGRAARSEMLTFYQHQISEQLSLHLRDYLAQSVEVGAAVQLHQRTLEALIRRDKIMLERVTDEYLNVIEESEIVRGQASPVRLLRRAMG